MSVLGRNKLASGRRPPRNGYALLLIALMAALLIAPVARQLGGSRSVDSMTIVVVLIAGLYAMSRRRQLRNTLVILGGAFALAHFLFFVGADSKAGQIGVDLTAIFFFGFVVVAIIQDVLSRKDNVSWGLIYGALSAYLLMGVVFALSFSLLSAHDPASFDGISRAAGDDFSSFIYLSFVTLTTLGYGDITPGTQIAGSFLIVEALVGQIYLTVLVARLVGMHISAEVAELDD